MVVLGPIYDGDDPVPVADLKRKSVRHRQRTLLVVDDFGNAVSYVRRCPNCRRFHPLDFNYFAASATDSMGMQWKCNSCNAFCLYVRAKRLGPEEIARQGRENYAKRMQDPKYADRARRDAAARHQKMRAKQDPEVRRAKHRERAKAYREKMKSDSARLAKRRETRRLAYADRRRREGKEVRMIKPYKGKPNDLDQYGLPLDPSPLVDIVQRRMEVEDRTIEDMCASLGFSARALYRWRTDGISFDGADRMLTGLGLNWWDVWDTAEAQRIFEG